MVRVQLVSGQIWAHAHAGCGYALGEYASWLPTPVNVPPPQLLELVNSESNKGNEMLTQKMTIRFIIDLIRTGDIELLAENACLLKEISCQLKKNR